MEFCKKCDYAIPCKCLPELKDSPSLPVNKIVGSVKTQTIVEGESNNQLDARNIFGDDYVDEIFKKIETMKKTI